MESRFAARPFEAPAAMARRRGLARILCWAALIVVVPGGRAAGVAEETEPKPPQPPPAAPKKTKPKAKPDYAQELREIDAQEKSEMGLIARVSLVPDALRH
jgi:hypothetical protein